MMFSMLIARSVRCPIICRTFSTCSPSLNAQNSPLYQLRQKTGLAYNLCREALNKHNDDINRAENWLQAQALTHGLQRATKVSNRRTNEGLLSLAISQDNKSLTMLELNCETDFVAKNQLFKDLAIDLTEQVASSEHNFSPHQNHIDSAIEEFGASDNTLTNISNQIAPYLTKLGENIRVQKVAHFKSNCNLTYLYGQVHSQASQRTTDNHDILAGRFGAIVALKLQAGSQIPSRATGNRLCHHVIGYSPTYIELPQELRESLEEAEKEKASSSEQSNTIEEGEEDDRDMDGLYLDSSKNRDDWPSIMDQQLIMSEDQTVRDFCKENQMSIIYFKRFECGVDH